MVKTGRKSRRCSAQETAHRSDPTPKNTSSNSRKTNITPHNPTTNNPPSTKSLSTTNTVLAMLNPNSLTVIHISWTKCIYLINTVWNSHDRTNAWIFGMLSSTVALPRKLLHLTVMKVWRKKNRIKKFTYCTVSGNTARLALCLTEITITSNTK